MKIRKEKREWLEQECAKITTANEQRKSKELFQQIKKVKGDKLYARNQCIKDKDGNTLTDAKDVLNRWHDYGKGLFSFENKEDAPEFPTESLEPEPLFDEIESAIHQLKSGKAPGLDNVPGELLKFSDISSKKALHSLCCKIWRSGTWPTEWKLQEFVMLYKSGDQKNCGNYRTIALISHASKIMLIIILNRLKQKVDFELSECQAGYRSNRGTIDMIFVLQIIIEKIRNTRDEAFITFIDYSKAFDSVNHHQLFKILVDMGFPTHLVSLIANLYENQKATIRWNGDHCEYFNIEKGVRQGCILSPHLFSMYTEQIMRQSELEDEGVKISGEKISNLRYADDTALLANSYDSMCNILNKVNDAGERSGLKLNAKKTKVMHINSKDKHEPIIVNGDTLEYVLNMKYLGSVKESDGSCSIDVKTRIAMAKRKMVDLNNIWKDRGIPTKLKTQLLKSLIWPVMMYGCEAWTLRADELNKINAAELWFYRRLLRVSWTDKRTNESILKELNTKRLLLSEIEKRRLKYVGHAVRHRKTSLMSTVLMGKVEGRRKQGRPAKNLTSNLVETSGCGGLQAMVAHCRNREGWRALVSSRVAATVVIGDADR